MKLHQWFTAAMICCLGVLAPLWAQDKEEPKPMPKSVVLVREHIDKMEFGKEAGEVTLQAGAAVNAVFPEHHMVIVRFRIYPVARIMPEGLSASNIFAVTKEGKLQHLKDAKTLEKFFRANHAAVKNDKEAKTLLAAWLTLTPEFHQDGMFKFEVMAKEFAYEDNKATGRATVMQGGNGQVSAELLIDKEGKLAKATEKAAIRPGPRPICQATKLLDADPLVRRIVEQDLLIMGLSARDYLMEQRERATPELRQAIDRLWQQIQRNGW
ncbi:MAG: hypothetical protein EXR98_00765 [Gemmataceae bacterium]|nr:hypothetical protein [Gemmataceae bacterium]